MASSKIGGLFVSLDLNYAKFVDGLDKSRTKSTAFGVAVGNVMSNIALSVGRMVGNVAASLPRLIENSIDVADSMGKAAQKAQVSVESFSALAHAADLSDVSVESLTTSLGRFGRNIAEAQSGNKKLAAAFKDVGVSLNDLKTLKVDEVFAKVAGGFSAIPDGAKKAQVGFNLFGRAYQDLIPLLNQGTEGINRTTAEAKQLGLVIGEQTAKQAEQFNDNLKSLRGSVTGMGQAITKDLLPKLVDLSAVTLEWVKTSDAIPRLTQTITDLFHGLAIEAGAATVAYDGLVVSFLSVEKAYLKLKSGMLIGLPFAWPLREQINKELSEVQKSLDKAQVNLGNSLNAFDVLIGNREAPKLPALISPDNPELPEIVDTAAQKKLEDLIATFQRSLKPADDLAVELAQLRASFSDLDIIKVRGDEIEKAAAQQREFGFSIPPLIANLEALNQAQKTHAVLAEAAAISDDIFKTTLDKVADGSLSAAAQLGKLHEQMAKTADELERLQTFGKPRDFGFIEAMNLDELKIEAPKVKKQMEDLAKTGEQIGLAISSGIEDAIQKWEGFGKLAIGILDDIAATILRNKVIAPLTGWLGDVLGSLGSVFGGIGGGGAASAPLPLVGAFAEGGKPPVGKASIVGEKGPEIFVPTVPGVIVPNPQTELLLRNRKRLFKSVDEMERIYSLGSKLGTDVGSAFSQLDEKSKGHGTFGKLFDKVGKIFANSTGFDDSLSKIGGASFGLNQLQSKWGLNRLQSSWGLSRLQSSWGIDRLQSSWGIDRLQSSLPKLIYNIGKTFFSSKGIEGRATGGPVAAGRTYLGGELGPERFVANSSKSSDSGGVVIYNSIDARGAEVGVEQKIATVLRQFGPALIEAAVSAQIDRKLRTA